MLHILLPHWGKIHCLLNSVVLSALQLRQQQSAYASLAEGCLSSTFPHVSCVWAAVSKAVCAQVLRRENSKGSWASQVTGLLKEHFGETPALPEVKLSLLKSQSYPWAQLELNAGGSIITHKSWKWPKNTLGHIFTSSSISALMSSSNSKSSN